MIQQTMTEVFDSVEKDKVVIGESIIQNEINRLQHQYMDMLSDYISIPYSQKLYEDLVVDFDNRIKEKKELCATVSKPERQHMEQIIEWYKNQKMDAKEKMEDLKRKEDNFMKWKWFFEEKIKCWQTML